MFMLSQCLIDLGHKVRESTPETPPASDKRHCAHIPASHPLAIVLVGSLCALECVTL